MDIFVLFLFAINDYALSVLFQNRSVYAFEGVGLLYFSFVSQVFNAYIDVAHLISTLDFSDQVS